MGQTLSEPVVEKVRRLSTASLVSVQPCRTTLNIRPIDHVTL